MGERAHGAAVSATKWLNRIAQGFYEAELVKSAVKKRFFWF
jgi:hypothetical protein